MTRKVVGLYRLLRPACDDPAMGMNRMREILHAMAAVIGLATLGLGSAASLAQALPATAGDTLNGKHIVLADAARGKPTILIMGFSERSSTGCNDWFKAVHNDTALAAVPEYEAAELEQAPSYIVPLVRIAMRNGLSSAAQEHVLLLTQDDQLWWSFFAGSAPNDAYVVLLDAKGQVAWRGHGPARDLEPMLRAAYVKGNLGGRQN